MQFQVPQNITMEDRIVGPLTIIQFVIVVVGGGLAFFLFNLTALPNSVSRGGAGVIALITAIIAIGKFNDQPMYRFFKYILAYIVTPKTRVWHKNGGEVLLISKSEHKDDASQLHAPKRVSQADIARLATVLDSRGAQGSIPSVVAPTSKPKGTNS
ncbi:hypothetical protein BH11PAT4_BH11PAT4_5980 [soil metagenome]